MRTWNYGTVIAVSYQEEYNKIKCIIQSDSFILVGSYHQHYHDHWKKNSHALHTVYDNNMCKSNIPQNTSMSIELKPGKETMGRRVNNTNNFMVATTATVFYYFTCIHPSTDSEIHTNFSSPFSKHFCNRSNYTRYTTSFWVHLVDCTYWTEKYRLDSHIIRSVLHCYLTLYTYLSVIYYRYICGKAYFITAPS